MKNWDTTSSRKCTNHPTASDDNENNASGDARGADEQGGHKGGGEDWWKCGWGISDSVQVYYTL
jgi:hypothetical protein